MVFAVLLLSFTFCWASLTTNADGFLAAAISGFTGGNSEQTSNCVEWSEYGPCFSTNDHSFWNRLPRQCYENPYMKVITGLGLSIVHRLVGYAESFNRSANACGKCNMQLSCSSKCQKEPGKNSGGIADRVCDLATESQACALTDKAYDVRSQSCHIWPPRDRSKRDFFGLFVPANIQNTIWSLKPLNCISIDSKCYCCCAPFRVNPCDAQCTLNPCSNQISFSVSSIVALRDQWLRQRTGFGK